MDDEEFEERKKRMEKRHMEDNYRLMKEKHGETSSGSSDFFKKALTYSDVKEAWDKVYNPDYSGWTMEQLTEELKKTINELQNLKK